MAFEQNYQESMAHFKSAEDFLIKQKVKSMPSSPTAADNMNGCFDCNICLDSAHDPVVTLCGHLYCWPCIYKWLNVQSSSPESQELPKCPVCKANTSSSSLVPLYGGGTNSSGSEAKKLQLDQVIPRRPPAVGMNSLPSSTTSMTSHTSQHFHPHPFPPQPQYITPPLGNYAPMTNIGGAAMTNLFSPRAGMFGDTVFARMFGSSDASLFAYPNTYPIRRQEMQVDKSLNRVSIFLFCCFVLCLLLF